MNYISLVQWAINEGISEQRARVLAAEGRIKGAIQVGRNWVVPPHAARHIGRRSSVRRRIIERSGIPPDNLEVVLVGDEK